MKTAILGVVGVPGRYGGFETLAENLVYYHAKKNNKSILTVWCSGKDNIDRPAQFESADLRYIDLSANGIQSIFYDALSLFDAIRSGHDRLVLLGVSGALVLPLIRIISNAKIITNVDGIEWKRTKWGFLARIYLRFSELLAVQCSHELIADNQGIADYIIDKYSRKSHVIGYGGDHSIETDFTAVKNEGVQSDLPEMYALALCRIEPENNIHVILEAWSHLQIPLVIVGNWANSSYGLDLKSRYSCIRNLYLLDPIYDKGPLHLLRSRANLYIHGHSAGGTNPSLVEMMHFGIPILAHGCNFNRYTTEDQALYFKSEAELVQQVRGLTVESSISVGAKMLEIAQRRYTWDRVGRDYFNLIEKCR